MAQKRDSTGTEKEQTTEDLAISSQEEELLALSPQLNTRWVQGAVPDHVTEMWAVTPPLAPTLLRPEHYGDTNTQAISGQYVWANISCQGWAQL